jgi:tetratricopeptide (TPR) repeat protein
MVRSKAAVIVGAALVAFQVAAWANGVAVPSGPAAPNSRARTPTEMAAEVYNSGIGHRDRAVKAEAEAKKAKKDSDRAKHEKKSSEELAKALKDFQRALELNPNMPEAYNGIGFTYRKLGDYAKALANYDQALQLAPKFADAIEYRGEAYLALDRLDDAKQAYLTLFAMDRKQANALMKAMQAYVEKKKTDPAGLDPAVLSGFEKWIAERAGVADATRAMGLQSSHATWH